MRFKEIRPGMVIHCPKEEDARVLLEHLDELGYEWDSGTLQPKFITLKECYMLWKDMTITTPSLGYCQDIGQTITEFSDLIEPEPRFKVGDRAIVRDDLIIGKDYGDCEFSKGMELFKGKIVTIKECFPGGGYEIEEDDKKWLWSNSMLKTMENVDENKSTEMSAVEVLEWLFKHYYDGVYANVFGCDCHFDTLVKIYMGNEKKLIDKITAYEAAKKAQKPIEIEWVNMCQIIELKDNGTATPDRVIADEIPLVDGKDIEIRVGEILKAFKRENPNWNVYAVLNRRCLIKEDGVID